MPVLGGAWLSGFVRAVHRASFEEDLDISEGAVLKRCLAGSREDPGALLEETESPEAEARLRDQSEKAAQLGIFGAPKWVARRADPRSSGSHGEPILEPWTSRASAAGERSSGTGAGGSARSSGPACGSSSWASRC